MLENIRHALRRSLYQAFYSRRKEMRTRLPLLHRSQEKRRARSSRERRDLSPVRSRKPLMVPFAREGEGTGL